MTVPIVSTLVVSWVISVFFTLIKVPFYKCYRAIKARKCVLQVEYNSVYSGMEFDMPLSYAQHLSFSCSVLFFSGFIPALVGLLPIYYFVHYWLDKYQSKLFLGKLILI